MSKTGLLILGAAIDAIFALLWGLYLWLAWGLLIDPVFTAPNLPYGYAVGVALVVGSLTASGPAESEMEVAVATGVVRLLGAFLSLGILSIFL